MRKLVVLLVVLLLAGCSQGNKSETRSAKAESLAAKRESRKAEREERKTLQESMMAEFKESKALKEEEEKSIHDKYDKVILDNDIVKITLTTKMKARGSFDIKVKNKTNKNITIVSFPSYFTSKAFDGEAQTDHSDMFPRQFAPKAEEKSTFEFTMHKQTNLGLETDDDYFDENGMVHVRTHFNIIESIPEGTTDGDTIKKHMDNPLFDGYAEYDAYNYK